MSRPFQNSTAAGMLRTSPLPSSPPIPPQATPGLASARNTCWSDLPDQYRSPVCWLRVPLTPPGAAPVPPLSSLLAYSCLLRSCYAFSCRFPSFLHLLSASITHRQFRNRPSHPISSGGDAGALVGVRRPPPFVMSIVPSLPTLYLGCRRRRCAARPRDAFRPESKMDLC